MDTSSAGAGCPNQVSKKTVDRESVLQLYRRSREANEGGVGQGVPHVAGVTVNEVVLTSVRLVGDDDDVAPLR